MNKEIKELNKKAEKYSKKIKKVHSEISKVIVGQEDVVEKLLIALISDGHVLIEGVPGLAKTLMVKTLSECLDCGFVRLHLATPEFACGELRLSAKRYDSIKFPFLFSLAGEFRCFRY